MFICLLQEADYAPIQLLFAIVLVVCEGLPTEISSHSNSADRSSSGFVKARIRFVQFIPMRVSHVFIPTIFSVFDCGK